MISKKACVNMLGCKLLLSMRLLNPCLSGRRRRTTNVVATIAPPSFLFSSLYTQSRPTASKVYVADVGHSPQTLVWAARAMAHYEPNCSEIDYGYQEQKQKDDGRPYFFTTWPLPTTYISLFGGSTKNDFENVRRRLVFVKCNNEDDGLVFSDYWMTV